MSRQETSVNSHLDNPKPVIFTDRVTLYLMQRLGIATNADPITLTPEEEVQLAQRQEENQIYADVKDLVDDILAELPDIDEENLLEILTTEGVEAPDLIRVANQHRSQRQLLRGAKPGSITDLKD